MKRKFVFFGLLFVIIIGLVVFMLSFMSNQADIEIGVKRGEEAYERLRMSLESDKKPYFEFLRGHEQYQKTIDNTVILEGVKTVENSDQYKYSIEALEAGLYHLSANIALGENQMSPMTFEVRINGERQFDEAKTLDIPVLWRDESKAFYLDSYGDETLPRQIVLTKKHVLAFYNNTYLSQEPLLFYLEAGKNEIEINIVSSGDVSFYELSAYRHEALPSYEVYLADRVDNQIISFEEASIDINAIAYTEKNSSYVRMNSYKSASVTPTDPLDKKLNIIDGMGWQSPGQSISYDIEIGSDGFYELSLHYFHNKRDFNVYRTLLIDGEVPFQEVQAYGFKPTRGEAWTNHTFSDETGQPYQIYLNKGLHTITLKAEQEPVAKSMARLQLLIDHINQFAIQIRKITGKDIDKDRTWYLTRYIPETESYLQAYYDLIGSVIEELATQAPNGQQSSTLSYLNKALVKIEKMQEKPDELPLYFEDLYSGTGSVTQMLGDTMDRLYEQPLSLNAIYLRRGTELPDENASFLENLSFSLKGFISTFTTKKYVVVSDPEVLNIWVSRPVTYIDTMQKLVDAEFTPETGIKVKISVMPDANKIILANAANLSPDIALGLLSYMPYDLAIRGAAYDMTQFDDFWSVASDFAPGAFMPYIYNDGLYAIPETIDFNAMIYRKDIFNHLDLKIPNTWNDIIDILPSLQRYGMNFYHPIAGGQSLKWFYQTSPFILQYGGKLYSEDGLTTAIQEPEAVEGLTFLTKLFSTYSLPEQVPIFYNSFRYGTLPIGIVDFNTYLQIKNAAPELKGQWGLVDYPATVLADGTESRWYIANGTGAVIMKKSQKVDESWTFLKWWLSQEVQSSYAYALQSTYGPTFVWLSGNLTALENAPIDAEDKQVIMRQIPWIQDVARTPGQYMLERGISDVWNKSVFDGVTPRVGIDQQSIAINREIRKKMIEFGFIDQEGTWLKPYKIRDIDWVIEQMEKGGNTYGEN